MNRFLLLGLLYLMVSSTYAQVTTEITTKTEFRIESESEIEPTIFELLEMTNVMQKVVTGNINIRLPEDVKNEEEVIDEIIESYIAKMQPVLTELILPAFMEIYQEKFTEEELKELVKFYQTDLGKKVLEAEQELFAEAMGEAILACNYLLIESKNEVLEKHGYSKSKKSKKSKKKKRN